LSLTHHLARQAFYAACTLGRPFGGIRPHRIYRLLARAGFTQPDLRWVTTGLGFRMKLCPFYLIDREIMAFGAYDRTLHAALERFVKPGMTCLDVGANIGDATLHMARLVGPSGRVHAFEPAPSPSARLREHVAANHFQDRVTIHMLALSDREGTARFSFAPAAVENQGMGSLVSNDIEVVSMQTDVPLQTLDAFVETNDIASIGLVKIDIQGGETMFFRGAAQALRRFKPPLLLEVGSHELAAIGSNARELLRLVESLGYRVHHLGQDGSPAACIRSQDTPPDFDASNVICLAE
jgi:FkbM family methyltransferase